MRMRSYGKLGAALGIAALAFTGIAAAQDSGEPVEFVGVVEAMNDSSLTINGQTITLDNATLLDGDFQMGDPVLVEADVTTNGNIVAADVLSADASPLGNGEMLITGRVNNAAANMVQIGNHLIDTANADVNGALEPDVVVAIVADSDASGALEATDVFVAGSEANANADLSAAFDLNGDNSADLNDFTADAFALTGTLEQVNEANNTLVISGRTIETSDATLTNDFVIGSLVQAQVSDTGNNLFADLVTYANLHDEDATSSDTTSRSANEASGAADTTMNGSATGNGVPADLSDFNPNAQVETGEQSALGASAGRDEGSPSDTNDTNAQTDSMTNPATGSGVPANPEDFNPNAEIQTGEGAALGASAGGANG